jgi:GNAT superfamily N-acetyltransferase
VARLRSLLDKVRRSMREGGVRKTARLAASLLWSYVHERQPAIVLLKELDTVKVRARESDVRFERVARRHLPALAGLNRERGERRADARFAADVDNGYEGLVALRDGRLIGFYWWVDAHSAPPTSRWSIGAAIDELGLAIELGEGDVYGADFYVAEADRRGGTAQAILDHVETLLRDRGYERLWGYVIEDNRPARWTYSLRGYQPMWRVVRTRTLTVRRSRTETIGKEP